MKYCGVATRFKGIRVYTRSAMGMPRSETCLDELMSRVLGDLIQEGCVAKTADDLYVGGNSPSEVLDNWSRVLALLQKNNLRLSAAKTIICPRKATILGWVWSNGTLQASPHKLAALSSVEPPSTVQGLRSFIRAYKVLSCVLPIFADLLDPLDQATAGKESREKIAWSDELLLTFKTAQHALENHRTITIPQPQDALWIVTDGSVKNRGIAATLYVHRSGQLLLAGFFSVENLPSDYTSRNPKECLDSSCQICKFIVELEDSVIRSLSVRDVLQGSVKMPFTSRAAWQATQLECPHLRRTHSHLSQGTRPSKKATKIIDEALP